MLCGVHVCVFTYGANSGMNVLYVYKCMCGWVLGGVGVLYMLSAVCTCLGVVLDVCVCVALVL